MMQSLPSLTTAQMADVDRLMIEEYSILLIQMMENAGRNLAEQARRMLDGQLAGRHIVVLCGAGNNGGGGMVAARHLHNRGASVRVKFVGDPARLKDVPAHQWRILQAMDLAKNDDPDLAQADLIIDALIGYGLSGDPRRATAEWIVQANLSGRPILALDTPSGLDATTGVPGSPCIRANATLTLALPKAGLLQVNARHFVGGLYLADISVPPELYRRIGVEVGPLFAEDIVIRVN
ncbi:MAG: NAD(P)H-hydrate epimerase [Chloroflexi bacterium]|nr:NAD(P)H-hydrate epimerase [Chloroflexota bacterium]